MQDNINWLRTIKALKHKILCMTLGTRCMMTNISALFNTMKINTCPNLLTVSFAVTAKQDIMAVHCTSTLHLSLDIKVFAFTLFLLNLCWFIRDFEDVSVTGRENR